MEQKEHQNLIAQLSRVEQELMTVRRELREQARASAAMPDGPFLALRVLVGGIPFALPSAGIRLIVPHAKLSGVPNAPSAVLGALNVGGEAVVVVDLGQRMGLGRTLADPGTQIVFTMIHDRLTGLVLDRALGVSVLDAAGFEKPSGAMTSAAWVSWIGTVDGAIVQILNLEELLSRRELDLAVDLGGRSRDASLDRSCP